MRKVLLCILDGWGLGKKNKYNAIEVANTENFDAIAKKFDMGKLYASEKKVGLPIGQFGNSEVGHMNIGSGRIILQDILRIDKYSLFKERFSERIIEVEIEVDKSG